jgi:hypothetical protein
MKTQEARGAFLRISCRIGLFIALAMADFQSPPIGSRPPGGPRPFLSFSRATKRRLSPPSSGLILARDKGQNKQFAARISGGKLAHPQHAPGSPPRLLGACRSLRAPTTRAWFAAQFTGRLPFSTRTHHTRLVRRPAYWALAVLSRTHPARSLPLGRSPIPVVLCVRSLPAVSLFDVGPLRGPCSLWTPLGAGVLPM